jgi:hypothetical protein
MYDICPDTNPDILGASSLVTIVSAAGEPWPSCGPALQQFDCAVDLGFVAPLTTGTIYNPTNTPTPGTNTLSNIAGEVTSPASGSIFSYSAGGSEWTITALSIGKAVAGSTTSSGSGGVGSVVGGSGSATPGTAAGTAATTTTAAAKSNAQGLSVAPVLPAIILVLGGLLVVL